jgi:hypothetical protein
VGENADFSGRREGFGRIFYKKTPEPNAIKLRRNGFVGLCFRSRVNRPESGLVAPPDTVFSDELGEWQTTRGRQRLSLVAASLMAQRLTPNLCAITPDPFFSSL